MAAEVDAEDAAWAVAAPPMTVLQKEETLQQQQPRQLRPIVPHRSLPLHPEWIAAVQLQIPSVAPLPRPLHHLPFRMT